MRTSAIIGIVFASIIATGTLASGASAIESRERADVTEPSAQPLMLAETPRHFSDYQARLDESASQLQGAAERAPAVSWYERKTGRGAESSPEVAPASATPFTRSHDRAAKSCTASLALQRQRPWCG